VGRFAQIIGLSHGIANTMCGRSRLCRAAPSMGRSGPAGGVGMSRPQVAPSDIRANETNPVSVRRAGSRSWDRLAHQGASKPKESSPPKAGNAKSFFCLASGSSACRGVNRPRKRPSGSGQFVGVFQKCSGNRKRSARFWCALLFTTSWEIRRSAGGSVSPRSFPHTATIGATTPAGRAARAGPDSGGGFRVGMGASGRECAGGPPVGRATTALLEI
jgi:hypothetical protein